MRYLGIDYGTKKVGLALSDEAGVMGFPHGILPNTPRLFGDLLLLMKKEKVGGVVIGESKDFSGKENPIFAEVRALGVRIAKEADVPVFYESEVLTSAEARRTQIREVKSRAPKEYAPIDDSAAALILTSYLSRHDHH